MKRISTLALLAAGCVAVEPVPPPPPYAPPPSYAAWLGMAAYPSQGQAPELQRADDAACYEWARQETRIDPGAPPPPPPAVPVPGSGVASGAAAGVVAGAVIGGILGRDPLGGAVVGGMTGAMAGAAAEHEAQARTAHAAGQAQQARLDLFRRGFAACMEGRGYTVR